MVIVDVVELRVLTGVEFDGDKGEKGGGGGVGE